MVIILCSLFTVLSCNVLTISNVSKFFNNKINAVNITDINYWTTLPNTVWQAVHGEERATGVRLTDSRTTHAPVIRLRPSGVDVWKLSSHVRSLVQLLRSEVNAYPLERGTDWGWWSWRALGRLELTICCALEADCVTTRTQLPPPVSLLPSLPLMCWLAAFPFTQ